MRCRVCNRRLTDRESIRRGIGPVCARRRWTAEQRELDLSERIPGDPRVDGVVLRRDGNGRIGTNIDHVLVEHSPSGMEWGYSGSGPADLALNVLIAFGVDQETAIGFHQEFKDDVIARVPRNGGTIPPERITAWLDRHSMSVTA